MGFSLFPPIPTAGPLPLVLVCAKLALAQARCCVGTQTGIKLLRKAKTSRMRTMEGTIAEVIGEVTVQGDDAVRNRSTEQIMRLTKTMEGMSTTQLKLLFDALVRALAAQRSMRVRCQPGAVLQDTDKNGTLDREEVQKLVETVLQEAAVTDAVMASCFEEMDADHSGTIEWCAPFCCCEG